MKLNLWNASDRLVLVAEADVPHAPAVVIWGCGTIYRRVENGPCYDYKEADTLLLKMDGSVDKYFSYQGGMSGVDPG